MFPMALWCLSPRVSRLRRALRVLLACLLATAVPLLGVVVANPPAPLTGAEKEADSRIRGYWGPRTANTNWCEADYAVSHYVAEFWNSFSSLVIVAHGVYGILRHPFMELRFYTSYLFFGVVGIGSFLFHATLWRSMQLADELPMMWANGVFLFNVVAMQSKPGVSTRRKEVLFALLVVVQTILVVLFDDEDQNMFLLCYGSGVVFLTIQSSRLDAQFKVDTPLLEISLLSCTFHCCVLRFKCTALRATL